MACCSCCEKTGACCNAGVCSEETCADCESAGGLFQGVDTACIGMDDDECPCATPADPGLCEKCVAGTPTVYCPEGQNCCAGVCEAAPCPEPCDDVTDCPNYGEACESFFPDVPYLCCDDECEPHACYPGAQITLNFSKKTGCTAGFLSGVDEEEEFDVVISGGSLATCGETSVAASSSPCDTTWTLGVGCAVTDVAFDAGGVAVCEECYEFLGSSSCRLDCNGDCV